MLLGSMTNQDGRPDIYFSPSGGRVRLGGLMLGSRLNHNRKPVQGDHLVKIEAPRFSRPERAKCAFDKSSLQDHT
jgi:hypothetical protein